MHIKIKKLPPEQALTHIYARDYRTWFQRSIAFKDSAKAVLNDIVSELGIDINELGEGSMKTGPAYERYRVSLMLMGYAYETLFKGILSMRLKKSDKFKPEWFTHDLRKLCQEASIWVSLGEGLLLDTMTHTIEWAGKYPLAKREKQYKDYGLLPVHITGRGVLPYRLTKVLYALWDEIHRLATNSEKTS